MACSKELWSTTDQQQGRKWKFYMQRLLDRVLGAFWISKSILFSYRCDVWKTSQNDNSEQIDRQACSEWLGIQPDRWSLSNCKLCVGSMSFRSCFNPQQVVCCCIDNCCVDIGILFGIPVSVSAQLHVEVGIVRTYARLESDKWDRKIIWQEPEIGAE